MNIDDYIWFDGNTDFCEEVDFNICFSGGKDSAYMAYILVQKGHKIALHFVNTGMELPGMLEYVKRFAAELEVPIYIWNNPFVTWDTQFYKIRERGRSKGLMRGFPKITTPCWANRDIKQPIFKVINSLPGQKCIGFAFDERHRAKADMFQSDEYRFPLIEHKIEEKTCRRELEKLGLLNPLYTYFERLGCFCCPYQSEDSLRMLHKHFPEQWKEVIDYCNDSPHLFSINFKDPRILEKGFEQQSNLDKWLVTAAKKKLTMEEIETFNVENDGYISICKGTPSIPQSQSSYIHSNNCPQPLLTKI
jgi:3'-phosphoadenosine 5'-phosphosulfate sulfotransferase (PAPS reductase)/FAD synthetase